jgi:hypothetical protein
MSASVAGGYVAINGPRIERITRDQYAMIEDEVHRIATDGCADHDYADEQRGLLGAYRHKLPHGDRARVSDAGNYVLKAQADAHMASMGYAIPESMIDEVQALLRQAGYEA